MLKPINRPENSFLNSFLFVFGIFCTMPIISFFGVSIYVWMLTLLFIIVLFEIINNRCEFNVKVDKILILFFIFELISHFICLNYLPKTWNEDLITSLLQWFFVLIIYLYFSSKDKARSTKYFIDGVYYSSLIQMIWGFLQLLFYFRGGDLNNTVFRDTLHMVTESATQYQFGSLKISGLCWNAGNLAPLVIFGYVYSKNVYIKILFIILSFVSGSRTLYISMLTILALELIFRTRKSYGLTPKKVVTILILMIIVPLMILVNIDTINFLIAKMTKLLDFVNNAQTEGSTSNHLFYLTSIFQVTSKNSIINNLFGYGPNCSGYVFSKLFNIYNDGKKWAAECDYVNILWSYGYCGFITYYIWYISKLKRLYKLNKKYIIMFLTFLIAGFFYNITFNWVFLLIIFIFNYSRNYKDLFKDENDKSINKIID